MYIIDVKRTPIGKFMGSLSKFSAPELAKPLFNYFLNTYPYLKKFTDEVVIGNVLSAGIGQNPARIAAFLGGLADTVPAYTINQVCASGMNAIIQGFRAILAHAADNVISGGMESMSQAPYLLKNARKGLPFGTVTLIDSLQYDGLFCSLSGISMGETVENIVEKYHIKRRDQDHFSLASHRKVIASQKQGIFQGEIIPLPELAVDESPRSDTSLVKLAALKPIFKSNGAITAGNASSINDGAALALLTSEKALKKYKLTPKARIVDAVFVGLKPSLMGMGPKYAIEKILKRNKLSTDDIDLYEINEAFAVQVLAVIQTLHLDPHKVNLYGGALALGHPLGMSGTRIVGTLINALKRTRGKLGIASLCVGGGQGAAILLENI